MKKLLLTTLSLFMICSIVGCTGDDFTLDASAKNSKRGEELGYFTSFGLDWGITEEEVFSALDQEKSTFELNENIKPLSGELNSIERTYQKKAKLNGEEIILSLYFFNSSPSDAARLSSVSFIYQRDISPTEFKELCQKAEEMLLKQNVSVGKLMMITDEDDNITAEITSTAVLKGLPEEIKKAYAEGYKLQAKRFSESDPGLIEGIIISDDPLSHMSAPLSRLKATLDAGGENKKTRCSFALSGNSNGFLNVLALKSDLGE